MSLVSQLNSHDEKIIQSRTVKIGGVDVVVKFYPPVKDNPDHYRKRSDIKTGYDPKMARKERNHG